MFRAGGSIGLAMADPDLTGRERFGIRLNFGGFSGESAFAVSGQGVMAQNVLGSGMRLAVSGGLGVGLSRREVGGRIGAQFTW